MRWLVKMPTDEERLRTRRLTPQQVRFNVKISTMWCARQQGVLSLLSSCVAGMLVAWSGRKPCWMRAYIQPTCFDSHYVATWCSRRCQPWRTCGRLHQMPRLRTWRLQR